MLIGFTGNRCNLVAKLCEQFDCYRSYPAGGTAHQYRAGVDVHARAFELVDTQSCGEAGRTEDHAIAQCQPCWKRHNPTSGYSNTLPETTTGIHTKVEAGDENLIPTGKFVDSGLQHDACRVDTRGMRKVARDTRVAGR